MQTFFGGFHRIATKLLPLHEPEYLTFGLDCDFFFEFLKSTSQPNIAV